MSRSYINNPKFKTIIYYILINFVSSNNFKNHKLEKKIKSKIIVSENRCFIYSNLHTHIQAKN